MQLVNRARTLVSLLKNGEILEIQRRLVRLQERRAEANRSVGQQSDPAQDAWSQKIDALRATPQTGSRQWWQDDYIPQAYHLGDIDPHLDRIYSPLYEASYINDRTHEQFREGAEHHSAYYYQPDWYQYLLELGLRESGFDMKSDRKLKILDVGSGAGNTVLPLINIFPNAEILATELSVEMLVEMRKRLERMKWTDRASMLQLDAENLNFKPHTFDLVVGGAILHHLFTPEKTLQGVSRVLKPGGTALFFEPFAPGNMMLAIILQIILVKNLSAKEKIPAKMESYLKVYLEGCDTVWGHDKSDPKYRRIDDKWIFPQHYFMKLTAESGFSSCDLISLHNKEAPFRSQLKQIIVVYGGVPEDTIPGWVWEVAEGYDRNLSDDQKGDLLIEACVALKTAKAH